MVKRATHFTPQVLLSTPRRSPGIPNPSGTKVLYTLSTYSFETHEKVNESRVLDVDTGDSTELALGDDVSDLNWLDDDEFVYLQAGKESTSSICWASVKAVLREGKTVLGKTHYVAGKTDAPASSLKVTKLDEESFGFVLSAESTEKGALFNPEKAPKTHSSGRLYRSLFVRHWDRYVTKERNALFYGKLYKDASGGRWTTSELNNLLKSTRLECPIRPFGGTDNFDVKPSSVIFVAKDPELDPALHTKCNVYVAHVDSWAGGKAMIEEIKVPGFEGAATCPVWKPDGTGGAFLKMGEDGFQNHIFIFTNAGDQQASEAAMSKSWDRNPSAICFARDSQDLMVTAEDYGCTKVFMLSLPAASHPRSVTQHGTISDVKCLANGDVFVSGSSLTDNSFYAIIKLVASNASVQTVWHNSNTSGGNKLGLNDNQVSSIWTPANNPKINKEVHSWVVRPSNFNPKEKYPVVYLLHGGPQGAWGDAWSTRWNLAVFAEQGYIVIGPNFTGSTGYGQAFTDAINQNYGGDPYEDIVKVFEWVGKNMPEADNDRAIAAGASYGGYMAYWIQGHPLGRKFKAIVGHDGIFSTANLLSTDELYFAFHDLGRTSWYDPASLAEGSKRFSSQGHSHFGAKTSSDWKTWDPSEHLANWSTPQLVIHSSKDYRLPISESLAAFNVLQTRGVDSEFLTFPDENHFVLKPENSLVWHKVVFNFMNKYVGLPHFADEDPNSYDFFGGVKEEKEDEKRNVDEGKQTT